MNWQVKLGMSYLAGQWHSGMPLASHRSHTHFSLQAQVANFLRNGNWLHELASRILYELCGWPMAFLRQVELEMSYVAG